MNITLGKNVTFYTKFDENLINAKEIWKGFLTVCVLYAQFSEDQNSVFKP